MSKRPDAGWQGLPAAAARAIYGVVLAADDPATWALRAERRVERLREARPWPAE